MAQSKAKRSKKKAARVKSAPRAQSTVAVPGVQTTNPGTSEELNDIDGIEVDIASFEEGDIDVEVEIVDAAMRRSERVHLDEKVEIRGLFGSGPGTASDLTVRDASLHGVFVETAYLLEVGNPVAILFPLDEGGRLKVQGRVRWVTPFGGLKDARPGMGIELVSLGADARSALGALLYKRTRGA